MRLRWHTFTMGWKTTALALLLAACSEPVEDSPEAATDNSEQAKVVATVDGIAITETDQRLHQLERKKQGKVIEPDEIIDELVNLKVIVLQAQKLGFDQQPEIQAELRRQHDTILANLFINDQIGAIEISDDELTAEYEKQLVQMAAVEYNASHILLTRKEDALAAIERLENGDEFGRVASEVSTGPSAENGGELGWFRPESMVPEFSAAVQDLDKDEYTEEPIKTSYGWHVIRLTGKRDVARPPLKKVREQIRQLVINNRLNDFVHSLRKDMDVQIK